MVALGLQNYPDQDPVNPAIKQLSFLGVNVVDRIDLNRTRIQGREPAAHMFVKMSVLYICLQRVCQFCGRALSIGSVTSRMCI
jgi:hypothetical protein